MSDLFLNWTNSSNPIGVLGNYSDEQRSAASPLVEKVQTVSLAIIVVMGVFCNSLSLWVFLTPVLRSRSPGLYLAALALADNCVLLGEAFIWLRRHTDVQDLLSSTALCRTVYYLRYSGRLWSALLTTTITIERYLFIAHPLKSARVLTRFAARLNIFISFVASLTLSSYALYTLVGGKENEGGCNISLVREFKILDLVISRVLADAVTGFTVAVFTVMILYTLVKVRRRRKTLLPDIVTEGRVHFSNREIYLTLTLTLIAVSFLVLKLPYTIMWYVRDYKRRGNFLDPKDKVLLDNAVDITYVLAVLSYAINLFLYSLGGTIFRENLRNRFRRIRHVSLSFISTSFHRSSSSKDSQRKCRAGVDPEGGAPGARPLVQA